MSDSGNIEVVIAVFANESAAVGAHAGVQHWDDNRKDIALGSIATIMKVDGEIETTIDKAKGPLVSGVTGVVKSVLGPITLLAGLAGGVVDRFFEGSEDLTRENVEQLGEMLDDGSVAMVVICEEGQGQPTGEQLESMCGTVNIYEIAEEVILAAAEALEQAQNSSEQNSE